MKAPSFIENIYKATLAPNIDEEERQTHYRAKGLESFMRLCFLVMPEDIPIKAHQHDFLHMS